MTTLNIILIIAILTFTFSIILMDARILIIQLVLFLGIFAIKDTVGNTPYFLIGVLQAAHGLFTLVRCKKTIDYDYYLLMEKTHLIPKNITKDGNLGGNFSFFKKSF